MPLFPPSASDLPASPHATPAWARGCACHGGRRSFLQLLAAGGAVAAGSALAQVQVGEASWARQFIPAEKLEASAQTQYEQLLAQAKAKGALVQGAPLERLQRIAQRLIPHALAWNPRARDWRWQVALIRSDEVNAFCMPGGKIAFYTGILDKLKLSDDEVAMVMGHEMAHALREHAREQMAKNSLASLGLSATSQLLGLGDLGNLAARMGSQLLSLRFSRTDESDADLVGLEIAARAGYNPQAAVALWQKMGTATGNNGNGLSFLSTHPSGPERIRELQRNVPRVQGLYQQAR